MTLCELFLTQNYDTDKNSVHSYIDHMYNHLFSSKQLDALDVLEIGVYGGGSILLWRDYFVNATIDAIDINNCHDKLDTNRIRHIVADAYDTHIAQNLKQYDIIIDDGPHTLDSMLFVIDNYLPLLKNDGICVIEDIQEFDWIDQLIAKIQKPYSYEVIDLRSIKNRYDDLVLVIRKQR